MIARDALHIVHEWADVRELIARDDHATEPWAFVERGATGIALSPRFSRRDRPCFRCYALRRMSHGARQLAPARGLTEPMTRALAECTGRVAGALRFQIDVQGRVEEQTVLSLPTCRRCAALPRPSNVPLERALNDAVGLVHDLREVNALLPTVCARGACTEAFMPVRAENAGCACDTDRVQAKVRAIAEALERYCAAFAADSLRWAHPHELDEDRELLSCGDEPRAWVRGQRLCTGEPVWVPAAAVYIPYVPAPGEPAPRTVSSNGLAAGRTLEEAIDSGWREVHERDAFIRAWRSNAAPYAIDAPTLAAGLRVARVPALTGPPVVAAFFERSAPPYSVWGLACRATEAEASRAAQLEAISALALMEQHLASGVTLPEGPPRTLEHHALAHALRPSLRAARSAWLAPVGEHPLVAMQGPPPDACVVELTTDDVATFGLRVVRVLVPGALGLDDDALHPSLSGNLEPHPLA